MLNANISQKLFQRGHHDEQKTSHWKLEQQNVNCIYAMQPKRESIFNDIKSLQSFAQQKSFSKSTLKHTHIQWPQNVHSFLVIHALLNIYTANSQIVFPAK